MPGEEELYQERLSKLARLRERGIDPYPARFDRTHTSTDAIAAFEASERDGKDAPQVALGGRVTAQRDLGRASFLDLRDGSGRIQTFVGRDKVSEEDLATLKEVDLGDIIGVQGPLFRTRTGEITIEAHSITMLAKSLQTPPEK